MAYIPVPTTQKICKQCNTLYYAKDRRRLYCSSSCNTLAWMARKGTQKTYKLASGNLSFSLQNIGVTGLGATAAAVGNYVLNDLPFRKEVLAKLATMDKGIEQGLNQLLAAAQQHIDFVNAMKQIEPALEYRMKEVKRQRLETAKKRLKNG